MNNMNADITWDSPSMQNHQYFRRNHPSPVCPITTKGPTLRHEQPQDIASPGNDKTNNLPLRWG